MTPYRAAEILFDELQSGNDVLGCDNEIKTYDLEAYEEIFDVGYNFERYSPG